MFILFCYLFDNSTAQRNTCQRGWLTRDNRFFKMRFSFPGCAWEELETVILSSESKGSIYKHSLIHETLTRPEHGHSVPVTIIFQDSGTSFQIRFYISLGRATVPVRINIITSLRWPSFFWRSLCSFPHFLVVLATAIKLKLQEVEGLSCLSLKRRESCWFRYRVWLLVSTGWQHCFWVRSQLRKPLSPLVCCPLTPHYKISTYF